MNTPDPLWLAQRLASRPPAELVPLLTVGSATGEFRTRTQPWIDQNIFAPIRARGGAVYHLDIKAAEGVDIVGDLFDPAFLDRIAKMQVKSILVSNLFEHVTNRQAIADVLLKI